MKKELSDVIVARLESMQRDDPEGAHGEADKLLIVLIRSLGYNEVADAWERVPKWYA